MSRYRGPKIRIVRRLGELPGLTTKTTTRETLPGQHKKVRGKQSNISSYSIRLQEKQKLRYNYGLTEKQLLSYVKEARRLKGSTGSVLIQLLEMRLDNIVYRLGIGNTIPASRQIVNHGHIYVNNKKVTIPSFQCSPNDIIEIRNKQNSKNLVKRFLELPSYNVVPQYLEFEKETLKGKVKRLAENTETNLIINELLIVEYYSRR
jgi:small subunit ribosomal protein S4|tara:strand:- start:363 stop:977 length:615 start_codon:yes stop_codon:yes gene_type:complete